MQRDSNSPDQRIIDLIKSSASTAEASPSTGVTIRGNGNIVAGRDVHHVVHVHVAAPAPAPPPTEPLVELVNTQQKADLQALLRAWVSSTAARGGKPLSRQAAWLIFNSAMRVNSYRSLPAADFQRACAWLRDRAAGGPHAPAQPVPGGDQRQWQIETIFWICATHLGNAHFYQAFTRREFDKLHLTELTDGQLKRVLAYVRTCADQPQSQPVLNQTARVLPRKLPI